mmetsp:Transcript_17728/g.62115  ORF Transcript_17728/g.62115 Transcript_17728/m.62115 type:complete len:221 (+) Transcript_17728:1043-1705(+)
MGGIEQVGRPEREAAEVQVERGHGAAARPTRRRRRRQVQLGLPARRGAAAAALRGAHAPGPTEGHRERRRSARSLVDERQPCRQFSPAVSRVAPSPLFPNWGRGKRAQEAFCRHCFSVARRLPRGQPSRLRRHVAQRSPTLRSHCTVVIGGHALPKTPALASEIERGVPTSHAPLQLNAFLSTSSQGLARAGFGVIALAHVRFGVVCLYRSLVAVKTLQH